MSFTYGIAKIHTTKWAVTLNTADGGDTLAYFKTKGAAAAHIEELKTRDEANAAENRARKAKAAKAAKAVPAPRNGGARGLTRKQCVARLKELGYTGPTSYLMPKLRQIVADVEAAAKVSK